MKNNNISFDFDRLPIFSFAKVAAFVVGAISLVALASKIAGKTIDESQKKNPVRKPNPNKQAPSKQASGSFGGPRRKPTGDPDDEPSGPQKVNLQQLLSLAEKSSKQGDYDRAEQYYLLALETLEKVNADLFSIGIITYAVGLNYRKKHELEFAEEYIGRSINIFNEIIGDPATLNSNPTMASQVLDQYADMLATIAEVYADLEKYEEAEANLMKCFQFLEKKAEVIEQTQVNSKQEEDARQNEKVKTQKQIGVLYDNLSALRTKQQRLEEAEEAAKKAIKLLSGSFGPLEVITVQAQMKLAALYHDQRRMNDENNIYETILSEIEAESGKTGPRAASFLQFMGHQNMRKEGLSYAEACLQKSLEIYQNLADNEMDADRKTGNELEILNDLVNVFLNQGNESDASRIRQMTRELLKKAKNASPLVTTEFFKTVRCGFNYEPADKLEDLKIYYNFILERTDSKLTEPALVVCTFENPVEGEAPIVIEENITPEQTTVILKSGQLVKTEMKVYEATIELYKNAEKQEKLSVHHLFVKGTLDTTDVKDKEDLQMKLYEARTKSALFSH